MNTMIKVRMNSDRDFYIFSLTNRELGRYESKSFYIQADDIHRAVISERCRVIVKDGYSFCDLWYNKKSEKLEMRFSLLNCSCNGNFLKGRQITVEVSYSKMSAWYALGTDEPYKELHKDAPETGKLEIGNHDYLKKIIENPVVRKKFRKAIVNLVGWNKEITTHLYSDFSDYSFYFVKMRGEKRDDNGGLIFHKDYKNPDDLSLGRYSIHT
jgi:hypothetical protein